MLGPDALKELARKLGSFRVSEVPLNFYDNSFDTSTFYAIKSKESFRKENMPIMTFGKMNDDRKKTHFKKRSTSANHFKRSNKCGQKGSKKKGNKEKYSMVKD